MIINIPNPFARFMAKKVYFPDTQAKITAAWAAHTAQFDDLEAITDSKVDTFNATQPAAQENTMATLPIPQPIAIPQPTSKWKSILQHVLTVVTFGLAEFQKYAPSALVLTQVLFPEYAGAEKSIQERLVNVTGLIQNSIMTVQAKYASATASNETNAQKLGDVLALAGPEAVATLEAGGIKGGLDRVTAIVNAGVAVLHAMPAPEAK